MLLLFVSFHLLFLCPQINVLATDYGRPNSRTSSPAEVLINVIRNKQTPSFVGVPYKVNITETERVNAEIFQIRAEDLDSAVSMLAILPWL